MQDVWVQQQVEGVQQERLRWVEAPAGVEDAIRKLPQLVSVEC